MAARIEVVQGPDAGWRFTVWSGEVRIGRGAGHQLKLSDPALGDGHLRVQLKAGGYLVTNQMAHAIFLDGQLLAPGEQRTWYAGSGLQPTAGTLLRLEAVDATGAEGPGGVRAEPPGSGPKKEKKKTAAWEYAALTALALGLGLMAVRHFNRPEPPSPAVVYSTRVSPALAAVEKCDGVAGRWAKAARRAVQIAVFRQSEGREAEAKQYYLEAREVLASGQQAVNEKPHPEAAANALKLAADFVAAQLQNPLAPTRTEITR
ncbi:MAG: hypothetical protein ACKODX_00690 [Gemmata sp.]